jgi:CubicO group peptidase (beta-lactamase class C family)
VLPIQQTKGSGMRTKLIIIIHMIFIFAVQLQSQSKWGLPDSPTGKTGSAFLDAIAHDDDNNRRKFIETMFTESFRDAFSIEVHLTALNDTHQLLGDFELVGVKKKAPLKAELVLQSKESERRIRIVYHLEDQEPYRISLMGIEPVASTPNFTEMSDLKKYLEAQTVAGNFSGVVLIAKSNKPLLREAFGLASKRYQVPNNLNTKFNIGSINKIFTKVAIYQLYEKKKIDFDDPVGRYLTGLSDELAEKVTIRHLLEHRSGLGHYWNEAYESSFAKLRSVSDYVKLVKDQPFDFEPGSRQQYSNSGYVLLGAVVEQVSGVDYYEYIRKNIYSPAGMTSSDHYELDRPEENLATGYTNHNPDGSEGEGYKRNNTYFSLKGSPAGGGYSTVYDLWKFDEALKTGALFSNPDSEGAKAFKTIGGLGIAGGGPGTSAILESDWDAGYTVVVLSNYDPPMAEELGLEIMDWLRKTKP